MIEAPYVLERAAGMGLLGESTVRFELHLAAGGTQVSIIETPRKGLAAFASKLTSPLIHGALWGRNHASLAELAHIATELFATHHVPLSEAPAAYAMFQAKSDGAIKVVFKP